jgi:hypothetical protein
MGTQSSRPLSTSLVIILLVSFHPTALRSQTLTPRWMSEMPTVEKVLLEIKGRDEQDTIERQMGAFKHLLEIIDSMAYGLEHRFMPNKATPDENRFKDIYGKAYASLWYKAKNRDGWIKYVHDGDLWSDMLARLFSKNFQDLYRQSDNNTAVVMEKHRKESEGVVFGGPPAQANAGGDDFLGLCAAKGLDPITCFVQSGMKKIIKASNSEPVSPGLRLSGNYQSGNFSMSLNPYGDGAWVHCGDVFLLSHYVVERRNGQISVRIENEQDPFVLSLRPDGITLSGPVSVPIHGHSPGGGGGTATSATGSVPQTVQTTRTRELTPLEAKQYPNATKNGQTYTVNETTTSTEYDTTPAAQPKPWPAKTAPCRIGPLSRVVTNERASEKPDDFWSKILPDTGERIPNGLRMLGTYSGTDGARIQFLPEKALVACNATLVEQPYTIAFKGGAISINMAGAIGPKALTLGSDGALRGDNAVLLIRGRRKTGENRLGDESYAASSDSCSFGTLLPVQPKRE